MTETITMPRSVVEQALKALNASMPHNNDMDEDWPSHIAARRALRAALEQPQVNSPEIPEGWRQVPVEPTDSQIRAAQDTWWHACNCETYWDQIYAAMIAAAPQPPVAEQPQGEQEPVAWAEEIIEYLHAHHDTEMIKELDSGDALIRLDDAIAAVEEVAQRHAHPQPPRQPLTDLIKDAFFEGFTSVETYNDTVLNSVEEAWEEYKAAHEIGGEA